MTKAELVEKLSARGMEQSAAIAAVNNVIDIIAKTLKRGETITLRGLGTFKVRTVKEKIARNITKGEPVIVPAHRTVKLILSKEIKRSLERRL